MDQLYMRTRLLVGDRGVERLRQAYVAVIGLGGVGGYAVEALVRAGIGRLLLIDGAEIDPTNLNRQILALQDTVGRPKAEVARERIARINSRADVDARRLLLTPDNVGASLPPGIGYAIDAIDDVPAKFQLILTLHRRGIPFISCMGAGGKREPGALRVADIADTRGCPLARRIRRLLRKEGIDRGVRCVYSPENLAAAEESQRTRDTRRAVGVISYMPALAGLTAAAVIINDILDS